MLVYVCSIQKGEEIICENGIIQGNTIALFVHYYNKGTFTYTWNTSTYGYPFRHKKIA